MPARGFADSLYRDDDESYFLEEDLGRARRRVADLERAPFDGRVADETEYQRSLEAARENVRELEREWRGGA